MDPKPPITRLVLLYPSSKLNMVLFDSLVVFDPKAPFPLISMSKPTVVSICITSSYSF